MPFLAPSFARLPPLAYLLADQTEPRKTIARHLGVSLRTLQRYQASGNAPRAIYSQGLIGDRASRCAARGHTACRRSTGAWLNVAMSFN